jgi:endonuclease/exonuclease/phosphatase family metal-dependent hydrolase
MSLTHQGSLRVLTVNACVWIPGARTNPATVLVGMAFFTGLAFWLWVQVTLLGWYTWLTWPFALLFAFMLAPHVALVYSTVAMLLLGRSKWNDYKMERLSWLLEQMSNYDVVVVQELFGGITGGRFPAFFQTGAKAIGFTHCVKPTTIPQWPSLFHNNGLLIVSRYPIVVSSCIDFKHRMLFDYFSCAKGAIFAKIRMPCRESYLDVNIFTHHLMVKAGGLGKIYNYIGMFDLGTYKGQMNELCAFIRAHIGNTKDVHVIVAGDFNADIIGVGVQQATPRYRYAESELSQFGLVDQTRDRSTGGRWLASFGHLCEHTGVSLERVLSMGPMRGKVTMSVFILMFSLHSI